MGLKNIVVGDDGVLRVSAEASGGYAVRATGNPLTPPMYGAGGLFGVCGAHPTLINACVGPIGVERIFTWVGTDVESPLYDALVSIQSSGYDQAGLCEDCGKPSFKECMQTACFGRICQMTNEHAIDMVGLRMNHGVPRVALFGDITDPTGNVIIPRGQPIPDRFTLDLMGAAYNLRRQLGVYMWTGNPVNNLGGHWEFPGLFMLINVGKFDVMTGQACNALDSYMRNYGNNVIGAVGSPSIVAYIAGMIRTIRYRIAGANLNEATAAIHLVMHPILWDCVADAWACEYGLVCQNTTSSAPTRNDALAVADLRDYFRKNMVLRVDGVEYPVVLDNQIPVTAVPIGNETGFRSNIVLITTSVEGETITWGEFQNMEQTAAHVTAWFRSMFNANIVSFTDGGRYAVAPTTYGGFCFDGRILTKPRIIARMPQYLGRIYNVVCVPQGTYADVTGSGGLYELDGGTDAKPYLGLYGPCGNLDYLGDRQ
jgi:hypothetical protein